MNHRAPTPGAGLSRPESPALSIPCYAERRYGGVMEDELLMAIPPRVFLPKIIDGLEHRARNGLLLSDPPIRGQYGCPIRSWRQLQGSPLGCSSD
ncbi:MAG: hypothetical protein Ct9H300mP16_03330 [Pseudomonadota bacterium]|nr:MAG: hypothetical protein Ct9H300mP16_03330 [Pseudomonadota bacterium]